MTSKLLQLLSPLCLLLWMAVCGNAGEISKDEEQMTVDEIRRVMEQEMEEIIQYMDKDSEGVTDHKFSWEQHDDPVEEDEHKPLSLRARLLKELNEQERARRYIEEEAEEDMEEGDKDLHKQRQLATADYKIFGFRFRFSTGFKVRGMGRNAIVRFEPCIHDVADVCGRDRCVSIQPYNRVDNYVGKPTDSHELALMNAADTERFRRDVSFCLRPGLDEEDDRSLSLESVSYPGSFAAYDDDHQQWIIAKREDIEEMELASFQMDKVSGPNMCSMAWHCGSAQEFKCKAGRCIPRKNVGDLCSKATDCKSNKCITGLLGNFLAGQWTKMCGYDPNAPASANGQTARAR